MFVDTFFVLGTVVFRVAHKLTAFMNLLIEQENKYISKWTSNKAQEE